MSMTTGCRCRLRGRGLTNRLIDLLPEAFTPTRRVPNAETLAALAEAEMLAHDPAAPTFATVEDLLRDLES